jgi:hypothetical protein
MVIKYQVEYGILVAIIKSYLPYLMRGKGDCASGSLASSCSIIRSRFCWPGKSLSRPILTDSSAVDCAKFSYFHFLSLFRVSLHETSRNVYFIRKFMPTGKIFFRNSYIIMQLNVGAWEVQQLPSIKPLFPFLWLFAFWTSKLIVRDKR